MTYIRLAVLSMLFLLAGFLAWNSYLQWKYLAQQDPLKIDSSSIFKEANNQKFRMEAAEIHRELSFNLWPDEQRQLKRRLIANIKNRLQASPLNGHLWLELVNAQQQFGMFGSEYSSNLNNAIKLNEWQKKAFATLAYHCIHQKNDLREDALTQCRALLAQPRSEQIIGNVKHKLGIEKQQFERIVQEARALQ